MKEKNELVVKEVEFNGSNLLAVQEYSTEKIYVGVKWVCDGLTLSEGQMKNERKRIQEDLVLSKGGRNLILPTNGGNQEVLCIELNYLPLWLAKISITPKMQEEKPEIVERLVEYQIKAKDVLALAFLNKQQILPQTYKEALVALLEKVEENEKLLIQNEEMKPKADSYDHFMNGKNNQDMNEVAKSLNVGRNKLFAFLRRKEVLMKNNLPYQRYKNCDYFDVIEIPVKKGIYVINETKTVVTAKGIDFINKLLKEVDYKI